MSLKSKRYIIVFIFLLGCNNNDQYIRNYKVYKNSLESESVKSIPELGFIWDAPDSWIEYNSDSSMRLASYQVPYYGYESSKIDYGDVSIFMFNKDSGTDQENVNRRINELRRRIAGEQNGNANANRNASAPPQRARTPSPPAAENRNAPAENRNTAGAENRNDRPVNQRRLDRLLQRLDYVNNASGLDLHRFNWLDDDQKIGELNPSWNWIGYLPNFDSDINDAITLILL